MSQTTALGSGPIRVITSNGDQLLIPLSAIIYDEAHDPNPYAQGYSQQEVKDRIKHLVEIGELRPVEPPPPTPAMLLQSLLPGPHGNAQVTITYNTAMTSFSFQVTVTNTYTGLTRASILSELGLGTSPGLAHIQPGTSVPDVPRECTDVAFSDGSGTAPSSVTILKSGGTTTAFKLDAWKLGVDGDKTKATISAVVPDANDPNNPDKTTFTLKLDWTDTVSLDPSAINLATINSRFGHVITASAPPGGTLAAPQPGTFAIGGGVDFVPAKALLNSK